MREKIYSLLFFLMGLSWLIPVRRVSRFLELCFVMLYVMSHLYRHNGLKLNKRIISVIIFSALWLMHLAITGFLEAKRIGFVPTLTMSFVFSDRRVMVEHLLYGPFSGIIKKIIMTIYTIFFTYIFIEILVDGRAKNFIYWFSWGTILFMPFMIMYMRNVDILHNGRLSPMMPGGFPIHPNNFAIRLLFTYWANVISMQREKIKLVNICHVIYCFLCVILIFLTGSRSSLLSLDSVVKVN